jgi:hypothetical protein
LTLTGTDIEKIHASHKIDDFFKHWVLTSANATILYPLFILAPKIVCINEFNLQTGEIQYIYISIIILLYAIFGDIWVVF